MFSVGPEQLHICWYYYFALERCGVRFSTRRSVILTVIVVFLIPSWHMAAQYLTLGHDLFPQIYYL